MENPIYNETTDHPPGFGQIHVPKCVQNGILWEALVKTSECAVEQSERGLIVARHRYKEDPRYLIALGLAKFASEIYPLAVVDNDPEVVARYQQTRDAMREAYQEFVDRYEKGSLTYGIATKTIFREWREAQGAAA